jgi:Phage integrase family
VLLSVTLGMRESYEDWQALGRETWSPAAGAPMLVVADGAPRLTGAIEQCWPASDRQSQGDVPPTAPVFPTRTGRRRNKDNVRARVIAPTVRRVNELREATGGSPLPPGVTPHTLRHTFISFLLEARAPPRYVMGQVGHTDPKTTLRIYAHLLERDRSGVGRALDDLIHGSIPPATTPEGSTAQGTGGSPPLAAEASAFGPREWAREQRSDRKRDALKPGPIRETLAFAGTFRMGAAGFEPATSRV